MKNPNLLTRSSYTFFNSLLKIKDIVNLAKSNGFSNAFLVDKNIMYGVMEFYSRCLKEGIKPIVGIQINDDVLIAKNTNGYKKLIKISSSIEREKNLNIAYKNDEDLILLDFKLNPVLYKEASDINVLKDFYSVANSDDFNEPSSHFLSREEFEIVYGKQNLAKVDDIISEVNFEISEMKNILPSFKVNNKKVDSKDYLENTLKEKLMFLLNNDRSLNREKYIKRVSYELKIISKMKFESYFLIVADIVNWAKSNDIFVGPGRGSAPGSLTSYLLNITTIDPIRNNLLFERFLNPERISMPDIDVDFEDKRREEVIEYIAAKYGSENVAQIITYQTLRAKMSFKDIARIRGLSAKETTEITKLIPDNLTLEETYKKNKRFREKINSLSILAEIYESAKLIEGLPRQFSTHAAGIVISDDPIVNSIPVQKGYGEILQTQYSMDYMEYNGLLKIDILGLRNLSFLKEIIDVIKEKRHEIVNLEQISFDDKKVFDLLSRGRTSGIFQLESSGMKAALREINVSKFEDIVAVTSLYRPGPMKMISEFSKRKKGINKIDYINEKIEKILKPTYGIIVYQEQIMKIVQVFSNFSLAKADILRRAIGKKDITLLESLKDEFFSGAKNNGFDDSVIEKTYDLIFEFSSYGFNRSHAYAYTVISYWLAWLKINYQIEFMLSLLNSSIGNSVKFPEYVSECEEAKLKIVPPSILYSRSNNTLIEDKIYIGFRVLKRVGESIIKVITKLKKNINEQTTFIDFMIEAEKYGLTKTSIEILIKSGALSNFGMNKQTLLNSLDRVYDYLKMIKVKTGDEIVFNKTIVNEPNIENVEDFNEDEYFSEVTGFSLSTNKQDEVFEELSERLKVPLQSLQNLHQDEKVIFIGEIISIKKITTKTNRKMAFGLITNGSNKINVTYWPAVYEKFSNLLLPTTKLIFYGQADFKRKETIIINKVEEIK